MRHSGYECATHRLPTNVFVVATKNNEEIFSSKLLGRTPYTQIQYHRAYFARVPIYTHFFMTMDISPDAVEYVSQALQNGPVTFSGVSTDLNIHLTKSKQLLYQYYLANSSSVSASFIATGMLQGNYLVKLLHGEEDAKNAAHHFDKLDGVQIYSLALASNSFSDHDIAIYEMKHATDFAKLGEKYLLGSIKGPELTPATPMAKKAPEPVARPPAASRSEPVQKLKTDEAPPKKKLEYTSRKEKPATSLLSRYVSRKGEKRANELPDPKPAKPAYQYKSRKTEQNQPKERVVISHVEPDHDMEVDVEPPVPSHAPKSDLNQLFLDDLSDFDDDTMDVEAEQPIVVELVEPAQEPDPNTAIVESKVTPHIPEDSVLRSITSKQSEPEAELIQEAEVPETTIDEDGYITTYRAKPTPKPTPKPATSERAVAAAKKRTEPEKKKTDGKKKQASLMSFFGKR